MTQAAIKTTTVQKMDHPVNVTVAGAATDTASHQRQLAAS
jgi:hypothetical protein